MEYLADAGDDKIDALYTLLIKNTEEDDEDSNDETHDITDEQFLQLENERESYITKKPMLRDDPK